MFEYYVVELNGNVVTPAYSKEVAKLQEKCIKARIYLIHAPAYKGLEDELCERINNTVKIKQLSKG